MVSVSGGKDSAALSLHLRELGVEHERVFMDTGWEHPLTYEYLRGDLSRVLGPITEIRAERQMEELILAKGMFPSRLRRFCTEELKVEPMVKYLRARMEAGEQVINTIGIRHGESAARALTLEWDFNGRFGCEVWCPLITWTLDDVIAIHKRHQLRPNPLYLMGASRVGCWPCIFERKAGVRLVADTDPARIDRLRALESEVAKAAQARYERDRAAWLAEPDPEPPAEDVKRHARWESKRDRLMRPFVAPAWFQSWGQSQRGPANTDEFCSPLPIDEAVAWSRTAFGGTQFEMFAPTDGDAGCVRWGLCDTESKESDRA